MIFKMEILKNKKCLIISKYNSNGGGEYFLLESMKWLTDISMNVYFISFYNSSNKEHSSYSCVTTEYGSRIIEVQNGMTFKNIFNWIRLINPDIVHTQGENRYLTMKVCNILNIPIIQGFHFWSNAILLNSSSLNRDILNNKHKKNPEFDEIVNHSQAIYVASEFMKNVFKSVIDYECKWVIEPVPLKELCVAVKTNNKYVTFINIHKYKGGEVLLYYLEKYVDIPFLAVRTEANSERLDEEIKEIMSKRSHCKFMERTDIRKIYSMSKIVVVASLCDETYCRVCTECIFNNIPMICSNKGNIPNIVKDSSLYIDLEDKNSWNEALETLYFNNETYKKYVMLSKERAKHISDVIPKTTFYQMFSETINSKKMIMFFSPWCDMGLGIQTKNYVNILIKHNIETCIFAFKPYADIIQSDPSEWIHDNIYYSPHTRENVTDKEIINFIQKYKISKCLIPETCFYKVFYIAKLLRKFNIQTYAIPNIEIVRKKEISNHKEFNKILCNNHLCYQKFTDYGIDNLYYLGYSIPPQNFIPKFSDSVKDKNIKSDRKIKFLFLGGNNAFTRKHVLEVLEAFNHLKLCEITVCIQNITIEQAKLIEKYQDLDHIKIIISSMTCYEISELYKSCDCVIQVSSHEGLGLGFYEALSYGLPVITVNALPHTEIIENDRNGIVIPCKFKDMKDNNDGIVKGSYFDVQDLISTVRGLSIKKLDRLKKNCVNIRKKMYEEFEDKFIKVIKS